MGFEEQVNYKGVMSPPLNPAETMELSLEVEPMLRFKDPSSDFKVNTLSNSHKNYNFAESPTFKRIESAKLLNLPMV